MEGTKGLLISGGVFSRGAGAWREEEEVVGRL